MVASYAGHTDVVEVLLGAGANVEARDDQGTNNKNGRSNVNHHQCICFTNGENGKKQKAISAIVR